MNRVKLFFYELLSGDAVLGNYADGIDSVAQRFGCNLIYIAVENHNLTSGNVINEYLVDSLVAFNVQQICGWVRIDIKVCICNAVNTYVAGTIVGNVDVESDFVGEFTVVAEYLTVIILKEDVTSTITAVDTITGSIINIQDISASFSRINIIHTFDYIVGICPRTAGNDYCTIGG